MGSCAVATAGECGRIESEQPAVYAVPFVEPGPLHLLTYLGIKYAAYAAWCAVGLHWVMAVPPPSAYRAGVFWGLLRLVMGFGFGVAIAEAVTRLNLSGHPEGLTLYLLVYVPIRVFEWGVMLCLFAAAERRGALWCRGAAWVMGGILISCLADVPIFYWIGGFPVGRFWC